MRSIYPGIYTVQAGPYRKSRIDTYGALFIAGWDLLSDGKTMFTTLAKRIP